MVAEFLGTFVLVFAGTGAIVTDETSNGAVTRVGVALTFGLIVLAMIYTVGDSLAHISIQQSASDSLQREGSHFEK